MKLNPTKCVFVVLSGKFLVFIVSQQGIEANPDKIKAIMEIKSSAIVKEVQGLIEKVATLNKFVSQVTTNAYPSSMS